MILYLIIYIPLGLQIHYSMGHKLTIQRCRDIFGIRMLEAIWQAFNL